MLSLVEAAVWLLEDTLFGDCGNLLDSPMVVIPDVGTEEIVEVMASDCVALLISLVEIAGELIGVAKEQLVLVIELVVAKEVFEVATDKFVVVDVGCVSLGK